MHKKKGPSLTGIIFAILMSLLGIIDAMGTYPVPEPGSKIGQMATISTIKEGRKWATRPIHRPNSIFY